MGTTYFRAGAGGKTERLAWRLAAGRYDTDGVSSYRLGQEQDGHENTGVSGRALFTVQIPRSGRLDEVRLPLDEFIGKRGRRGKEAPKRWLVLGVRDAQS